MIDGDCALRLQDEWRPDSQTWQFFRVLIEHYAALNGPGMSDDLDLPPLAAIKAFCERQRISPLIARQMLDLCALPPEYARWCRGEQMLNTQKMLCQSAYSRELFANPGLPKCRVLKGFGVAAGIYKSAADRHCGDVDLLFAGPADVRCAEKVLAKMDYGIIDSAQMYKGQMASLYFQVKKTANHLFPDGATTLELHWLEPDRGFFPSFLAKDASYIVQETPVGKLQVLRPAELFVYLSSHGGRSTWRRLKWLIDIYLLAKQFDVEDWERATTISRQEGLTRHSDIAVRLVAMWFPSVASHIPAAVREDLAPLDGALKLCLSHEKALSVDGAKSFKDYCATGFYYFCLGGLRWRFTNFRKLFFRIEDFQSRPWAIWQAVILGPIIRPFSALYRRVHSSRPPTNAPSKRRGG
jgi:hypothetical protein